MTKPGRMPLLALGGACALFLSLASCGNKCPFGVVARRAFPGQVACCGASARHDLQAAADLEVDVANLGIAQTGRVDAFLTRGDCDRLFDGDYPPPTGTAPRCSVILGPIAPGAISARTKVSAGAYRLHLHAYSSNTAPALYGVDVVFWGENCSGVVF
jgi:hypothetical protein